MKIYIPECKTCKNSIGLGVQAENRARLRRIAGGSNFNVTCGTCGCTHTYNVGDVWAKSDKSATAAGLILGGIVGLLAGPIGAILGSLAGGTVGNVNDQEDSRRRDVFNRSA